MLDGIRARWHRLKAGEPGARFQGQYRENQGSRKAGWGRTASVAVGVALMLAGFVLLFVPGPGLLLIAIGAAVLARQSLAAARFLDWLEVQGRRLAPRVRS